MNEKPRRAILISSLGASFNQKDSPRQLQKTILINWNKFDRLRHLRYSGHMKTLPLKSLGFLALLLCTAAHADAESQWVHVSLQTLSGYPFTCVTSRIQDAWGERDYPGAGSRLYYGFASPKQVSSAEAAQKAPWENPSSLKLPPEQTGAISDTLRIDPWTGIDIRVPAGKVLVFRLAFERHTPESCEGSPQFTYSHAEGSVHVAKAATPVGQCETAATQAARLTAFAEMKAQGISVAYPGPEVLSLKTIQADEEYQISVAWDQATYRVRTALKAYTCAISEKITRE